MHVEIIGTPIDLGADRRGVDMGPSAIRYAGLYAGLADLGHSITDRGNLPLIVADEAEAGSERAKYIGPIVNLAKDVAAVVRDIRERNHFPVVLGGDHSTSLGSVAGAVASGRRLGLIWMDAHGDFNTPDTTRSGNVHGMVLAALAGYGDVRMVELCGVAPKVPAAAIALVGVRQLDPGERSLLHEAGVHIFTMHEVDRLGMAEVMTRALAATALQPDGVHLSLDLDVVDPLRAPGVGTPVAGGLNYREAQLAMEIIAESGRLVSMDAVEVNPILDDHNGTARLAVDLILSALGKRIL